MIIWKQWKNKPNKIMILERIKIMKISKFIFNFNKYILKNKNVLKCWKVNNYPIQTYYNEIGNIFKIQYFLEFKSPKNIVKISFLSKTKSYDELTGIIIYDKKFLNPLFFFNVENIKSQIIIKTFMELGNKIDELKFKKKILKENLLKIVKDVFIFISKFPSLIQLYWMADFLNKEIKFNIIEKNSKTKYENENNEEMFRNQKEDENPFKIYQNLINYLNMLIKGNKKSNGMLITGKPGLSKSYIVRRTLYFSNLKPGKDYIIEKGGANSFGSLYKLLFHNRKMLIVLDDFDSPLNDPNMSNLLKAATDHYPNKIITYVPDDSNGQKRDFAFPPLPNKFRFEGKIIIITNKQKEEIEPALLNRLIVFEVKYSTKELIEIMNNFVKYIQPETNLKLKLEVIKYFKELFQKNKNIVIDFRTFDASIDVRKAFKDWKPQVRRIVKFNEK
jgi:hypothetical protein